MKKILFILAIGFSTVLVSCGSNGSDKETKTAEAITHEVSTESDIKPIYLTTEEFKEKIWDYENSPEEWVYKGELPCIVDFYADWCKPCKMVAPIMDDLADHYDGKVIIYKVNTDEQRELSTVFQVRSIPSILFAPMDGKPAMQPGAMSKEQYMEIINDFVLKENKTNNKQES